ncbi:MAG TPA: tail fiber domain-containing protein [Bacteroidales bacterium]|nr:tail fiber domain-containing protein [Bacteroidales bacterium]HRZ48078.1 tail fiber domain-containing protein [Bacteroidales bacterium]
MKRILTLAGFLLMSAWMSGQAPQKMSYQAVIRDAASHLVVNHPVGMQITILQGSASGTEVYREVFLPNPQTNSNGLVTLEIGTGTPLAGTFSTIDWSNGPYFLKTETDPLGGTSYTLTGTTQLLSVPYALHAATVQTITETDPLFSGSPAAGVTSNNIANWSSAYSWGNHATAGYITSNQPIALSGDVTGTGQTAIPTTIAANSVTSSKIADNAVLANKISTNAVTETKIIDGAVTANKIGSSAVTEVKIGTGAVTENKIGTAAVSDTKLANGAVTETKIGTGAVTTTKIADNAVNANKIASSSVGSSQIASGAVTMTKINATGTPSSSTYLRGDGQWASVSGMPAGTSNQTLYHNGSAWVSSSFLTSTGTGLAINTLPIANIQLTLDRPMNNYGSGYCNILAIRNGGTAATNGGSNWGFTGVDAAIKGVSNYGNNFSAALAGYGYLDFPNSAAVFGSAYAGNIWGALGFKDASSNLWSGYFNDDVCINGTLKITGGAPGSYKILTSDPSGSAAWSDNITVNGTFKLASGSPGIGKVLTSDATGNASWNNPSGFWMSGGNNIYNTNSGNIGIGTLSPDRKLHVEGSTSVQYTSGGSVGYFENIQTGSSDPAAVCGMTSMTNDGYGIGGSFTSKYKGVYGEALSGTWTGFSTGVHGHATGMSGIRYGIYGSYSVSGTAVGYGVYSNGNGGYSGNWSNLSDQKFKKNIQPLDSALFRLMLLSPKTFEMRVEEYPYMNLNPGRHSGLIAQELQQVVPEVVSQGAHEGATKDETIEFLQVDYIALIPMLIKAIQEQQAQIETLKQTVETLQKNQ